MHLNLLPLITATDNYGMIRDLWAIPSVRDTWTRITSANGGYYTGSFEINSLAPSDIKDFFNRYLGYEVQEHAVNQVTWEGFIYRMTLEMNGTQYTRTLEPDLFHNKVQVFYSNLAVVDTNQGALVYRTAPLRFSDAGQDFSAWQTLAGNATYRIQVANTNDTTSWGYLGAASTVTNPNDTIAVYQDLTMGTPGWNDQDPIGPPALTAYSYQVFQVEFEGIRERSAWAEAVDSEAAFGTIEYVISLGGAEATAAEALRDRHIDEYGYPRTRMSGGVEIIVGQRRNEAPRLMVECAGFVSTLFWKYRAWSLTSNISALLVSVTNSSQFVRASGSVVGINMMESTIDCYPMPQRMGDLIQALVDQGDAAGTPYQWGVLNDRILYYGAQPTAPTYTLAGGQLYDLAGTPVIPQLLKAGFLLQTREAPAGILPFGGGAMTTTNVAYVEEVEFSAPNRLRLTLSDPNLTEILASQIQEGTYESGLKVEYGST